MKNQKVIFVDDSLDAAKEKAKALLPSGLKIKKERIIFNGNEARSEKGVGKTEEEAFQAARRKVRSGAIVMEEKLIFSPSNITKSIKAVDDKSARAEMAKAIDNSAEIREIKLEKKGINILNIWKTPHIYRVEAFQPAVAEVIFKPKCEIEVVFGQDQCGKCGRSWDGIERELASAKARGVFIYGEGSPTLLYCDVCNESFCGRCQADLGYNSGCPNCRQAID